MYYVVEFKDGSMDVFFEKGLAMDYAKKSGGTYKEVKRG